PTAIHERTSLVGRLFPDHQRRRFRCLLKARFTLLLRRSNAQGSELGDILPETGESGDAASRIMQWCEAALDRPASAVPLEDAALEELLRLIAGIPVGDLEHRSRAEQLRRL